MDRYPLAIVHVADVADVLACVAYARENVLPLAIRGGGHHGGGFGVWDLDAGCSVMSVPQ